MLRFLRTVLLAAIAVSLVTVAVANLQPVTLRLLPEGLGAALGIGRSYEVPLFLVILGAVLGGVALGLVWEWVRESKHRSAATQHRRDKVRLEREVDRLRQAAAPEGDRDDVLMLLEAAERQR